MRYVTFIFLFISSISFAGWNDIIATPMEDITIVGSPVDVKIKYERDLGLGMLNPNVEGLRVKFTLGINGKSLGVVASDSDGVAKTDFIPASKGRFSVYAQMLDDEEEPTPSEIPIYAINKEDEVVVTDIDGTISNLPDYLIPYYGDEAPTFNYAPTLFRLLSENFHIIYLTNRDDAMYNSTHAFLSLHDFPNGAVIMNQWSSIDDLPYFRDPLHPAYFKMEILKNLLEKGIKITYGIGNANSDAFAYTQSSINCYILESDEEIEYPCTIFRTYRGLKSKLVK